MEFEDLMVIWDSQYDQPIYGINEEGLHNSLRRKSKQFRRLIFWQRFQTYCGGGIMFAAIVGLLILNASGVLGEIGSSRALFGWEIAASLVALVCWLQFTLSVFLGHQRQKKREQVESTSLRDDLDREIKQIRYQIKTRSHIMLGFLPPYLGGVLFITVVFGATHISYWVLVPFVVLMIIALLFESRCQQRMVELKIVPALAELETLREKLSH